jgi:hypothetical protein
MAIRHVFFAAVVMQLINARSAVNVMHDCLIDEAALQLCQIEKFGYSGSDPPPCT